MSVQLFIDEVAVDMDNGTRFTLNRSVNKIAELKISGDYSNNFTLPATDVNRAVFGDSLEIQSADKGVYKRFPAVVEDGGVVLYGYCVVTGYTEKKIQVEFYGGNLNVFNAIGNGKLNDMNFDEYSHQFTKDNILASRTNNWQDGYIYPFVNTSLTLQHISIVTPFMHADYCIPLMFAKKVFLKIFNDAGFRLEGDLFLQNSVFNNLLIDLATNVPDPLQINCSAGNNYNGFLHSFTGNTPDYNIYYDTIINDPSGYIDFFVSGLGVTYSGYAFQPPSSDGSYTIRIITAIVVDKGGMPNWGVGAPWAVGDPNWGCCYYKGNIYECIGNAGNVAPDTNMGTGGAGQGVNPFWHPLVRGIEYVVDGAVVASKNFVGGVVTVEDYTMKNVGCDTVANARITFNPTVSGGIVGSAYNPKFGSGAGSRVIVTEAKGGSVVIGAYCNPTGNFHDMSKTEFVKNIALMFGLIFDSNGVDNVVRVHQYKDYEKNKGKARDWSDKLVKDSSIKYRSSQFARRNYFLYDEIDSPDKELFKLDEYYASGFIDIDDDGITETEKDLTKLTFAPSYPAINAFGESRRVPHIFKYPQTIVSLDKETLKWAELTPRVLLLNRYDDTISVEMEFIDAIFPADLPVYYNDNHPYCVFGAPELPAHLRWDSLLEHSYREYKRNIQHYKGCELKFNLTPDDVYNFDFSLPIYVDYYSAYFIVEKFNNYITDKPTTVSLLKMN